MTGLNLTPWRKRTGNVASSIHLFDTLHEQVDRLFDEFTNGSDWPSLPGTPSDHDMAPATDLSETEKFVEVTIDLPGVEDKDIDVTLSDNILTVKANRQSEAEDKTKDYHRVERSYGSYLRRIPMPCQVLGDDVQASFKKGVLAITLAKAPEAQSAQKKIEIRSQ